MRFRKCVVIALLTLSVIPAAASQEQMRRLRVTDPRTAYFMRVGQERSPLLRELIATIEAGDVVVYIGRARESSTTVAGRMRWIGAGVTDRFVQVSINGDLAPHDYVATIAHELQHVIEVIDHPDVRDLESLSALYRRIGERRDVGGRVVWDTQAARAAGRAVKREFLQHRP